MRILLIFVATQIFAADPGEIQKRIRANDLAWLANEVKDPSFITTKDARKQSALYYAAASGSLEAVELLLDNGANPNDANSLGVTPLIVAAPEPAKVKALLAKGADWKAKSQSGQSALGVAASSPRATESVKLLLAAGANPNERLFRGSTPLLNALVYGCGAENVRLLISAGADVKAIDGAGFSALHASPMCGLEITRQLIAAGASVNQKNVLSGQVKHGAVQLIGISPLMFAAAHAETPIVEALVNAGANVNDTDKRGMSPLIYAVANEEQRASTVKILLSKGADPKHKDNSGDDALAWAKKFNNPAVLALLGAKPDPIALVQSMVKPAALKGLGAQPALALLEKTNESFFKESGCSACHHSILLSLAASAAKSAGLTVDPALVQARSLRNKGMLTGMQPSFQQLIAPPGDLDSAIYALLEAKGNQVPTSPELEAVSRFLIARQNPEGQYTNRGVSRSPMEESDIHRTALAIWLIPQFSDSSAKATFAPRIAQAAAWLNSQTARNTDERAMKLLGLKWGNASQAAIDKAAKALKDSQLKDGSFSGNPHLSGDAYSTGLAIFALKQGAGHPAAHPAIAKAAQWLKATQREDASWYQKSRAPKFQPYFESGFPYGQDQWISNSATAWAVIGLSEAGSF